MTDLWFTKLFYGSQKFDNPDSSRLRILREKNVQEEDSPLNEFFDINGFSSKSLVRNLGSTFIYLLVYILGYLVLIINRFFASKLTL
jgi:hypothetical protein